MTADRKKAGILVIVQLSCIIFIFASASPLANHLLLLFIQMAGIAIGVWAVVAIGIGNMNISPLVKEEAELVTNGPYRFIRHPMYLAVLLVIWPVIVDRLSVVRSAAGIILTVDLIIKMLFEERLLQKQFPGYTTYMKTTKRLIPAIF